ncbi:aldo/keto reductase [Anaerosacchariphilus polymeriproducens]|uniref:Aldo/keto reductase n=1 Tax=Anaerosacchariphilus polymeriproducens TaxID=1812858 RepID=A0A371AS55_9FIRM|nr:aldo/keto reductase [Anaerosacchariphilus polymeriproducens]RDU22397.1 aldo/keto reductase [Anaerosacchariphilus polymeriproducens]
MYEQKYATLNNGVKLPMLGLGTFKMESGKQTVEAVKFALQTGYRHIDTAMIYQNEESVGQGILESEIRREDVFITSKVWNDQQGYESTLKAFEESLKRLSTEYLDLYLIHWPQKISCETWKALEELYEKGKVRAIGVSNFKIKHLEQLIQSAKIVPMINQVEFHPQLVQEDLMDYCSKHKIQVEAWSPLMHGKVIELPISQKLSEKYHKSIAQIVLRWEIQMGVVTIPKSVNEARIKENFDIFQFKLSDDDMKKISDLNTGVRIGPDPDWMYMF